MKLEFTFTGKVIIPSGYQILKSTDTIEKGDLWPFEKEWEFSHSVGTMVKKRFYIRKIQPPQSLNTKEIIERLHNIYSLSFPIDSAPLRKEIGQLIHDLS